MKNKKGQIGFQAVTITIATVAILLLVVIMIFSKTSNSAAPLIDDIAGTNTNETVTGALNTYITLANARECTLTDLWNTTAGAGNMFSNTSYYDFDGTRCAINVTCDGIPAGTCTGSAVRVKASYDYFNASAETLSFENIRGTALDALDLVVIGLIVLAAVAILGAVYLLSRN